MITRELDKKQVNLLRSAERACRSPNCKGDCKHWLMVTRRASKTLTKLSEVGLIALRDLKDARAATKYVQMHLTLVGRTAIACADAPFSESDFERGKHVQHQRTKLVYVLGEPYDNGFSANLVNADVSRPSAHFFSWAEACAFRVPTATETKRAKQSKPRAGFVGNPLDRVLARARKIRTKKAASAAR
jgi:hypothetical protein